MSLDNKLLAMLHGAWCSKAIHCKAIHGGLSLLLLCAVGELSAPDTRNSYLLEDKKPLHMYVGDYTVSS